MPLPFKIKRMLVSLDIYRMPLSFNVYRMVGKSMGDEVILNCDVFANPPAFRYEWSYLGHEPDKVYDPCYWTDRYVFHINIAPCENEILMLM